MTDNSKGIARHEAEFLLFTAPDGAVKVQVLFGDETAWLTQKALAELFGTTSLCPASSSSAGRQLFPKWK